MFAVSTKHVERNIRIEPSLAERWARALNPITRHEEASREMERQGTATFKSRGMPPWALEIVRTCARRSNVSLPTMAGDYRYREAVKTRNEAMYLIYFQKSRDPRMSCPRIGKWFGRDHTSVLHGIASHQEATGAIQLVGYDIKASRKRSIGYKRAKP